MSAWLDYEQAPPLWLPLAYMLAAPCWLLAGALLLAALPGDAPFRFQPAVLALTHVLTLGVLGNVMIGSLWQLLAVVAGVPVRAPRRLLLISHLPLQAGCAALAAGFWQGLSPAWLQAGALLLLPALLTPAGYGLRGLWRSPARDATSRSLLLALASLSLAALFGAASALTLSGRLPLPLTPLLDNHILWALGGWLCLLALAVARTVIPLFLITPAWQEKHLSQEQLLFGQLTLAAMTLGLGLASPSGWALSSLSLSLIAVGWRLLRALALSKRPADPSRRGWRLAMSSLMAAAACLGGLQAGMDSDALSMLAGGLMLGGFGLGTVLSMQGKILPFLLWLALKSAGLLRKQLPATHDLLSESAHARLLWLHAAWLLCGGTWIGWGMAAPFALATLALAGYWLALVMTVLRRYRQCLPRLQPPPSP
ncbi:hypothetical protein [uncultured Aquitalea sp.]|uniref:hypothetical protein n=1 Tax=uncultured Aquitalea sp. TaxID=540272 RepID=UPI0025DB2396|nr:hypothetical protein [uncultured Aquitalea sp.]